ncbi:MFS transporter [Plantactinospora sp. GCM10030261]|uniref:MFS transporter n=1 Tax=Plantactinospora sp. GCM10030261 TaxID=3273420 RepID=UPI003623DE6C
MILVPVRVPDTRVRRLSATLYGYAFLSELVLLYPVYALLFSDTGLSVWQISSLFVIWAVASILVEVPSGALADAVSRRLLLVCGPLLAAAGFALWVLAPSYWAFATGFVLWGAGNALGSGALEALVFTELDRLDAADRYAGVMGRAKAAGVTAVLLAILLAGPALALGGYPIIGAASVLACLLAAGVAARFPEHRPAGPIGGSPTAPTSGSPADADDPDPGDQGWWASLRGGLAEVRDHPPVRGALLLVPAVVTIWGALDEYAPLLVRDTGVEPRFVPPLLALIWAGVTVGGLLTGRFERLGGRGFAVLLVVAATAMAIGSLSGHPAGIALVALAFGGFQVASVLADARLQHRITGPSRATVTSLAGMATDVFIIVIYAGYGGVATATGNGPAFALFAVPYLVIAALLAYPRKRRAHRQRRS